MFSEEEGLLASGTQGAWIIEFHKYPVTFCKILFKTLGVRKWSAKKPLLPDTAVLPNMLFAMHVPNISGK